MPIIFIGALLLVPLIFLAYYACRIMRQSKDVFRDEVAMNYVELLKREEKEDKELKTSSSSTPSRGSSVNNFSLPKYGRSKKCVYVKEAKKLDFTGGWEDLSNEVCVICTENFTLECSVVELACGHGYHEGCFRGWVVDKEMSACPLCQKQVHTKTVLKWKWGVK